MALERRIKNILELQKESSQLDIKVIKKIDDLRNLIIGGKSTGDKIKDYIIVCSGKLSFDALDGKLRKLNEEIEKYQNEQVLVIYKSEHDFKKHITPSSHRSGLMDPSSKYTETRWKLGVLEGELGLI